MTASIHGIILKPVGLPHLRWAFEGVRAACRESLDSLFETDCPACGGKGVIEFLQRENDKLVRVAYRCHCANGRLYKMPSPADARAARATSGGQPPFPIPADIPIPSAPGGGPTPVGALHTGRTLAALSILLHTIGKIEDGAARDVIRLAFASCLEPCSRLILRQSRAAGQTAWYLQPVRNWREVNPWFPFEDRYQVLYEGKKAGNAILQDVRFGPDFGALEDGTANVILLTSRDGNGIIPQLPAASVDCAFLAAPGNSLMEGTLIHALWEAWLSESHNRDHVSTPNLEQPNWPSTASLDSLRHALKDGGCAHVFSSIGDHLFHEMLHQLGEDGLIPQQILLAPHPDASGRRSRSRTASPGLYIVHCVAGKRKSVHEGMQAAESLRRKLSETVRMRLALDGSGLGAEEILPAVYARLNAEEISVFARLPAGEQLQRAAAAFAILRAGKFTLRRGRSLASLRRKLIARIRQAVLDAESVAPAGSQASQRIWLPVERRLAAEGYTPRDLTAARKHVSRGQIQTHRRKHFTALLQVYGKSLGYRSRPLGRGGVGVVWRKTSAPEIHFTLRRRDIRVESASSREAAVDWGFLSYLDLEQAIHAWRRNHPERGTRLANSLNSTMETANGIPQTGIRQTSSPIADLRLQVVQNRKICAGHYLMEFKLPRSTQLDFLPGQFFHTICDPETGADRSNPLTLRRPFSIHGVRYPGFPRSALAGVDALPLEIREVLVRRPDRIDFLYRVVGDGTKALSRARKGAFLDAIGPLGNGFSIGDERTAIIVAGGIGVAPLMPLAERLRYLGKEVLIYLGAVRKEMLSLAVSRPLSAEGFDGAIENGAFDEIIRAEFTSIGAHILSVCTDDGSAGEKGLVTEILEQGILGGCVPRSDVCVYACGPAGMLKAVAEIAGRYGLPCQVSLEERMACGIGACYACTVRVSAPDGAIRKLRVCREGPVFQARDIQWKD